MDGDVATRLRVALVDLDAVGLDALPRALAHAPWPDIRLAIAPEATSALWRWARLAGVRRSGEIAALARVVVDVVVVDAASPRRPAVTELAAVLGAAVIPLASAAPEPVGPAGRRP